MDNFFIMLFCVVRQRRKHLFIDLRLLFIALEAKPIRIRDVILRRAVVRIRGANTIYNQAVIHSHGHQRTE